MSEFTGRVVIVTGAAGNLGQAVVRAFGGAGASLVLLDHAESRLPSLFPRLAESDQHLLATSVDSTVVGQIDSAVEAAVERFGRIDTLVNTVGGWRGGTAIQDTSIETWEYMIDLNARTVFIASRAALPYMLERGSGSIVNVAARAALTGGARNSAYSAAKSAVVRLTETMAAEVRRKGINVNCVLPGTIDTPENRRDMPEADHSRWVAPEAIADVIVFLASDAARAVHGAAVPVYGRS